MAHVINKDELPHSRTAHTFEGYRHGDANVSFFLTDAPPGSGPRLHTHPYAEVFIVQEGVGPHSPRAARPSKRPPARSWSCRPACPTSSSTPGPGV